MFALVSLLPILWVFLRWRQTSPHFAQPWAALRHYYVNLLQLDT